MRTIGTDVVVIDGDATGAGVVRDVAMRGYRTGLVERADLAQGTTGRYHGLLYSGGRYVVSDPRSATECAEENIILTRIHADAVDTTGGLFVSTPGDDPEFSDRFLAGAAASKVPAQEIPVAQALRQEPRLNPGITRAIAVADGLVDDWQMTWGAAVSAREYGAQILPYHEVTGIDRDDDQVRRVRTHDHKTGEDVNIDCTFIFDCGGPWSGKIAGLAGCHDVEVAPGRGIMIAMNHRLVNCVLNRCIYPTDGNILVSVHRRHHRHHRRQGHRRGPTPHPGQARAVMKEDNMPLQDKLIGQTVLNGQGDDPVRPHRERSAEQQAGAGGRGEDRRRPPRRSHADGAPHTFVGWMKKHKTPATPRTRGPVVFFHGCAGGYFEVETSIKTVQVLEHLGHEVIVPKQGCCGLAQQSNGLFDDATKSVLKLCDQLRTGGHDLTIASASGSCAGMLKHEAHEIMGVDAESLHDVGTRMREISEFLMELHQAGELPKDFARNDITVPYHAPCQLKSQGMGMPAITVMELIPGVKVIESGRACCGIAGTYGLKKEKYDIAQAVGQPLFDMVKEINEGIAVCDTETCRWQIEQGSGVKTVRPIWLVHKAYGLS